MKKLIIVMLLSLTMVSPCWARVLIRKADRIANIETPTEPGFCAWCCLSMLGRHQHIKQLYNLAEERAKEYTWQWDPKAEKWFKSTWVWTDYGKGTVINDYEIVYTWQWDKKQDKLVRLPSVYKTEDGRTMVYQPRNSGGHHALFNRLTKLGIKFRYQQYHNYDQKLIKDSIKAKKACMVVVNAWWELPKQGIEPDTHAIIVVDYNDEGIEFLDPNDTSSTYLASHEWFKQNFKGYILVLE